VQANYDEWIRFEIDALSDMIEIYTALLDDFKSEHPDVEFPTAIGVESLNEDDFSITMPETVYKQVLNKGGVSFQIISSEVSRGFDCVYLDNITFSITGREKRPLLDIRRPYDRYHPEPLNMTINGEPFSKLDSDRFGNPFFIHESEQLKTLYAFDPQVNEPYDAYLKHVEFSTDEMTLMSSNVQPLIADFNKTAPVGFYYTFDKIIIDNIPAKPDLLMLVEDGARHLIYEGQWEYNESLKLLTVFNKSFIADVYSGSGSVQRIQLRLYYSKINLYLEITDENGEAFEQVYATIEHIDTGMKWGAASDKQGNAYFIGIPPGSYYMRLSQYQHYDESGITVMSGVYSAKVVFQPTWNDVIDTAARFFNIPPALIYAAIIFLVAGTGITIVYNGGYQLLYKNTVKYLKKRAKTRTFQK